MTIEGLTTCASAFEPKETMDRLVAAVTGLGIAVLARIDHSAAAAKVDMALPPTEVLIFGNPKAGTPLMQASQTIGIDLPLRALVWRDAGGQTWLGYNEPKFLAARHRIGGEFAQIIEAMGNVLAAVAKQATTPDAGEPSSHPT